MNFRVYAISRNPAKVYHWSHWSRNWNALLLSHYYYDITIDTATLYTITKIISKIIGITVVAVLLPSPLLFTITTAITTATITIITIITIYC